MSEAALGLGGPGADAEDKAPALNMRPQRTVKVPVPESCLLSLSLLPPLPSPINEWEWKERAGVWLGDDQRTSRCVSIAKHLPV